MVAFIIIWSMRKNAVENARIKKMSPFGTSDYEGTVTVLGIQNLK